MKKYFEILFEDDHIIALNKKAHVLSIPDRFDPTLPNIRDTLIKKRDEIFIVHRLDAETSGILIIAKTADAHATLSQYWQEGKVQKIYLALSVKPPEEKGTIDIGIEEHSNKKGHYITSVNGKSSQTSYEVAESWDRFALLRLYLHTGRTHQIRVHLKHIGAPLLVDSKYGVSDKFFLSSIKKMRHHKYDQERPLLHRSSLHASMISLPHPIDQKLMTFEAPLPKDMKAVIYQLQKKYH